MRRLLSFLLMTTAVACSKPSADVTPSPPSASSAAASGVPSTAIATASAAPASSSAAAQSWQGTYKSAASTLTVPPDWNKVHWSDTQSTAGIGEGTMTLVVDAAGHLSGTVDGPLGPGTLDGMVTDGKLAATLRRKDPTDRGFAGTLLGTLAGGHGDGTMSVSLGLASALRTATFTLTPAAAGAGP
jgi:hypothetical protein